MVKDYNYSSLQEKIEPVGFTNVNDNLAYRYLSVKINGSPQAALQQVRSVWLKLNSQAPFEYTFMEDRFSTLYQTEIQLKNATSLATILNIIIIFLGVFGVVAFTLRKRNKELAIRKVLGADFKTIILLIVKDYFAMILMAALVAWPVAYWVTQKWLEGYAYRISQSLYTYVLVTAVLFLAVVLLVVIQSTKAATSSPVKSLRNE